MDPVAKKYLSKYAEPETRLGELLSGTWAAALIVPVCCESVQALDGLRLALHGAPSRSLVVMVVNANHDARPETEAQNSRFIAELSGLATEAVPVSNEPPSALLRFEHFDVLLIDRSTGPYKFASKQGVGLARKIGCDLALELYGNQKLTSPWLFSSDADVELPAAYFSLPAEAAARQNSALVYRFYHERSTDPSLDYATQLYELSLRYYVLGLAWARSPYAFHTIGSSLAICAEAYAKVRGFPKRLAAEDFYVLDKLSKVDPILRLEGDAIRIRARRSERTPFGTGRGTARIEADRRAGRATLLHHPESFDALRVVLKALNQAADARSVEPLFDELTVLRPKVRNAIAHVLAELEVREMMSFAVSQTRDERTLRRRVHTWFDAFRTLKFLHKLRDFELASIPWATAIAQAPFCPTTAASQDPAVENAELARQEHTLSGAVGPTLC